MAIDELTERYPEDYATWKRRPLELELQRRDGRRYRPLADLMQQADQFVAGLLKSIRSTPTPRCWSLHTTPSCAV